MFPDLWGVLDFMGETCTDMVFGGSKRCPVY